jgi:hypothetical protein
MSSIMKDKTQITLSTGNRYGIKVNAAQMTLPIRFENESEAKEFLDELGAFKYKTEEDGNGIWVHGGILRNRAGSLNVNSGNSIVLSSSWGDKKDWKIADVLLSYTSLGRKLKEYWKNNEKDFTEEAACKRLNEITSGMAPLLKKEQGRDQYISSKKDNRSHSPEYAK